ncbi:hypothetical protein K437DRAFT_254942 [Tilletiaria anomala UBC 951]|uniref:Uncharacterized protein n=1 Tax=Tilletiaria anomala (strain ATCC 24038 / CBS 436.72 / UBC 951) TaxID=1037660 RepID=A0A066WFS9_TILAU|nr:uncharacterized protein K437DRAFT_254942 [Tilletiaria anomala UBC 951]KDN51348.1 hypothetical protein K437DRAFT_254942 [Tilletiaria anomala UBC 951]
MPADVETEATIGSSSAIAAADSASSSSDAVPGSQPKVEDLAAVDGKLKTAQKHKEEGNAFYSQGKVVEALKEWHLTLLYAAGINSLSPNSGAKSSEEQNTQAKQICLSVYNNLCAAYIKQERWQKAVYAATKVLSLCPEKEPNLKALYRRAMAYYHLNENINAAKDLDLALDKAPQDPGLRALAANIAKADEEGRVKAQEKMRGFLNKQNS